MSLQEKLQEDLKNAVRAGDELRKSVLRYLRSEIRYQEIAEQRMLDDEGVIKVLGRLAQQRRDSIEAFKQGNRPDLVEKETAELGVILAYLPQQMSREEIVEIVQKAIQDTGATGPRDVGKVMGKVMPQVRGRAEGRVVSAVVSELLAGTGS